MYVKLYHNEGRQYKYSKYYVIYNTRLKIHPNDIVNKIILANNCETVYLCTRK